MPASSISADYARLYIICQRTSTRKQTVLVLLALLIISSYGDVQAQEPGFYSIDCGSAASRPYRDPTTTIVWTPDSDIMTEGLTGTVTAPSTEPGAVFTTLRYFPGNYSKYCYPLSPVMAGGTYIVRASFWMGGTTLYSTQVSGQVSFQFIIDTYVAADVTVPVPQQFVRYKELYVTANASRMTACVARTAGLAGADPPFISGLELRPLSTDTSGGALVEYFKYPILMVSRTDFAAPSSYPLRLRYPDDTFDRIWTESTSTYGINTTLPVSTLENSNRVPEKVVQNSLDGVGLLYTNVDALLQHVYMHTLFFAEIDLLVDRAGLRVFDLEVNGKTLVTGLDVYANVGAFRAMEIVNFTNTRSGWINISFNAANGSTFDPSVAGIEVLQFLDDPISFGTFDADALSIQDFLSNLSTISGYKGDPCLPTIYKFPWLSCNVDDLPRITAINLSNHGLDGKMPISINDLVELTTVSLNANNLQGGIPDMDKLVNLEYLDLSNNKLVGPIPTSLASLPKLRTLYIENNNLSGEIPLALLQKDKFNFKYSGNKNLCTCATKPPASSPIPPPETYRVSSSSSRNIGIIVGVVVAALLLVVVVIIILLKFCNKHSKTTQKKDNGTPTLPPQLPSDTDGQTPPVHASKAFTYNELHSATNNFSHVLDRGHGLDPLFQGTLQDGEHIAIKVFSKEEIQGEANFKQEANLLSTLHHKNIVQLFGYCEEGILALVYELMPRGSLYDALNGSNAFNSPLSWIERLSIMADVAQGLDYLHRQCVEVIVHGNLKSSNILLGHNLEGKISDLRIFENSDGADTTRVTNTFGYLDPEYLSLQLTPMLDVFSFGVVLLEVITGMPPVIRGNEGQDVRLVDWVRIVLKSENLDQLVDYRINGQFDSNSMWYVIDIAMNCTKFKSLQRPHMGEVYNCLQNIIQMYS